MTGLAIGGISSGMDTDSLINALMSVERAPLTKFNGQISANNQQKIAWNKLETLAKSVGDKSAELSSIARLYAATTKSSNTDIAEVSGTAAAGTAVSFTVTGLARAGQSALSGFTSASQVIGAGDVTVATATGTQTVHLGAGATVADLATAVAGTGLASAATLNTGDATLGTELLFTSKGTGTAAEATVTLSGFAQSYATTSVRAATDATLVMGSQTITRGTNTIDDLVPGVSLTLKKVSTEEVTLTSGRDDAAVLGKVKDFVASINSLLTNMATYAKGDPTGDSDGVLAGDPRLRTLNLSLMRSLTNSYGTGSTALLSQVGIRVERDGTLSFNESTFQDALAKNPDGVADLLSRTAATTDPRLSMTSASGAPDGTYAVSITQAGTTATTTSGAFTTLAADTAFSFTAGGKSATYTATAGTSGTALSSGLNSWFRSQNLNLTASYDGTALKVSAKAAGSAGSFTLSSSLWSATATGTDVAGTINGVAASGVGQTLSNSSFTFNVTATAADVAAAGGNLSLGTLTYNDGVGGVVGSLMGTTRDAGGLFPAALDALDTANKSAQDNITSLTRRLDQREKTMRAKFAAMELALARIQSTTPDFSKLTTDIYSGK